MEKSPTRFPEEPNNYSGGVAESAKFDGSVNLAKVADSMGCVGFRVEKPADIRQALDKALASGRPALVEVLGNPAIRAHNIVCKSGMHAFSKALAVEFGEFGITANTVSPGSLNTTRDWSQYPPNWVEMRKAQIPVKRLGTADEIAAACLYLAAEDAGFVTGQVIHVNGGQYMY